MFGEHISSMEDTFLQGAGKPQGADASQLMAPPLTCFPPTCENHPPSFLPFCARGRLGLGAGPHVCGGKENCWVVWGSLVSSHLPKTASSESEETEKCQDCLMAALPERHMLKILRQM